MKYKQASFTVAGLDSECWERIFGKTKGASSPEKADSVPPDRKMAKKGNNGKS